MADQNLPIASDDTLGSGNWTAGPALLFAKIGQTVTYGFLAQHIWSIAGDSQRSDISVTTLQPFLTYLLGGGWSLTALSEMSYNQENDTKTLPLQPGIAKVVNIGGSHFNIGMTVVNQTERRTGLPDNELRLGVTYVMQWNHDAARHD
jgi:hypothetical protein